MLPVVLEFGRNAEPECGAEARGGAASESTGLRAHWAGEGHEGEKRPHARAQGGRNSPGTDRQLRSPPEKKRTPMPRPR
eukprot:4222984-Alexandrium_andersonii.AAC.1